MSKTLTDYRKDLDQLRENRRKLRRSKDDLIADMKKDLDDEDTQEELEGLIRNGELEKAEEVIRKEKQNYTVR